MPTNRDFICQFLSYPYGHATWISDCDFDTLESAVHYTDTIVDVLGHPGRVLSQAQKRVVYSNPLTGTDYLLSQHARSVEEFDRISELIHHIGDPLEVVVVINEDRSWPAKSKRSRAQRAAAMIDALPGAGHDQTRYVWAYLRRPFDF